MHKNCTKVKNAKRDKILEKIQYTKNAKRDKILEKYNILNMHVQIQVKIPKV